MNSVAKKLIYTFVFAVAMGFMETSVVVYLRELYYPEGFSFPLRSMPDFVAKVEFFREIATILMLIAVGYFNGKTKLERFAYFAFAFAVWDLFYYVFLYVILAWPNSIFTWDILFLVPIPWVGPVWAPCLIACLMILGAIAVLLRKNKDAAFRMRKKWWVCLISGALICIFSFMLDFINYANNLSAIGKLILDPKFNELVQGYKPKEFNEYLFFTGFFFMAVPVFIHLKKPSN